jgi:hypothetical protein
VAANQFNFQCFPDKTLTAPYITLPVNSGLKPLTLQPGKKAQQDQSGIKYTGLSKKTIPLLPIFHLKGNENYRTYRGVKETHILQMPSFTNQNLHCQSIFVFTQLIPYSTPKHL